MPGPRLTALAQSLPSKVPFVGPETQERARGETYLARLGANESTFGPSSTAIRAMNDAALEVWKYCDPENFDLKAALSSHLAIPTDTIVVGEGIDALLGYLVRLLIAPNDRVVTSQGAYPTFNFHVSGYGGLLETVPYSNDQEDPVALIERAREVDAKLIYLANPDNPMGSWHAASTIQAAIDQVPEGCLLLLDEAYIEFAPDGTAPDIDISNPNVIRMRTFSKAYGMAGARIGYAFGHREIIGAFDKLRNHFAVNRIAQAGALAALTDQVYLRQTIANVKDSRARIGKIARDNGFVPLDSATNFVAVDCGRDEAYAKSILGALLDLGIFVRMPFVAPQSRCIRISAGTREDLGHFERALPRAIEMVG